VTSGPANGASAPVWVLSDGTPGNEKQALALASALAPAPPHRLRIDTRVPWRWFAPRWIPRDAGALGLTLSPPWPALAIACGRQGALGLRLLRRLSGGAVRTVQILDPRIDPRAFDLVVTPQHDALRGDNVITTQGALHAVDAAWLERARLDWPQLGALPGPRTALLLGGSNAALTLDQDYWRALASRIGMWLTRDGGSLLLSTSRRSPDWLRAAARAEFSAVPGVQWHGPDDGANPYAGMLAWADRIVVTPDSVNLLSEACATAVPVYSHVERPLHGKHATFLRDLLRAGRVRPMASDAAPWQVQPLRELDAVAAQVRQRLGL
jgi:uncharacterized protein